MGTIREELRSHSLNMWNGFDLHPPPRIQVTNPVDYKKGRTFSSRIFAPPEKGSFSGKEIRTVRNGLFFRAV